MGGGKHTNQSNVPKKQRNYSSDSGEVSAAGAGGSGGFDKSISNACLISFKTDIQVSVETLNVGAEFILVPAGNNTEGLQLISSGQKIGGYNGNRVGLLKQCINGGYVYGGTVDKVAQSSNGVVANCTITGKAPV